MGRREVKEVKLIRDCGRLLNRAEQVCDLNQLVTATALDYYRDLNELITGTSVC